MSRIGSFKVDVHLRSGGFISTPFGTLSTAEQFFAMHQDDKTDVVEIRELRRTGSGLGSWDIVEQWTHGSLGVPADSDARPTPGPWRATQCSCIRWEVNSEGDRWSAVAEVSVNTLGAYAVVAEVAEANARLIAAAPDLLEACEAMLSMPMPWLKTEQQRADAAAYRTLVTHAVNRAKGGVS